MANPNNPNNLSSPNLNSWEETLNDPGIGNPNNHNGTPIDHIDYESNKVDLEEKRDAVFQIYTKDFRTRMARQLAEEYLNARSEANVETSDLDRQIEENTRSESRAESSKENNRRGQKEEKNKGTRRTEFFRFFKKSKGVIKNEFQNGVARPVSTAHAVRVILGEESSNDPRLLELRQRLDELTDQYVKQSRERYERAVSEDSGNFNKNGEYEGPLAAKGELQIDKKGTRRVNHIISSVVSKSKDFIDESGKIDEEKLTKYIISRAEGYPQIIDECVEKCSSLLSHKASFDRAKDGMTVYTANLVGGASRRAGAVRETLERMKNRSLHTVSPELIAGAAGTAVVLTGGGLRSVAAGVGTVALTSALEGARRIRRDRKVMTEARANNLKTIGENAQSEEIITGNGEEPSVINGLTINNEERPIQEAMHYSNGVVRKIRGYERKIANIGAYEMADSVEMIKNINAAIEGGDMQKIITATAEAESRLMFVHEKGKAVIRFSSLDKRPEEERALREAIFRAKKIINNSNNGLEKDYLKTFKDFNKDIGRDVKFKDRILLGASIIEGMRRGARSGIIATLGFVASQELIASFDDNTIGFFETMFGKNSDASNQTVASRLAFGRLQHDVQAGQSFQTTRVDNLSEQEADNYRNMGWQVQQTNKGFSASGYVVDGKPAAIVFGDNNTPGSDNLELEMRLVDGKLSMPLDGTATSSADGGKTILDWGRMVQNGEAGVIKILPDGTGEFIPGATIDQSSGRVLLGDGSVTEGDLNKFRYCATVLEDGKYTIFASEGPTKFTTQEIKEAPVFSAVLHRITPIVEKVFYGLSTIGLVPASPSRTSLGKFVSVDNSGRPFGGPPLSSSSFDPGSDPIQTGVSGGGYHDGDNSFTHQSEIRTGKTANIPQGDWPDRLVFVNSGLESQDMLLELADRFTALTGERPRSSGSGVLKATIILWK